MLSVCQALPPLDEPILKTVTHYHAPSSVTTETLTVTVPAPANTRVAYSPVPISPSQSTAPPSGPTRVVEVLVDEDAQDAPVDGEDEPQTVTIVKRGRPSQRPRGWFNRW